MNKPHEDISTEILARLLAEALPRLDEPGARRENLTQTAAAT
ncbi:hypothetical protein [Geoalkalibacter halelectricus]